MLYAVSLFSSVKKTTGKLFKSEKKFSALKGLKQLNKGPIYNQSQNLLDSKGISEPIHNFYVSPDELCYSETEVVPNKSDWEKIILWSCET